MNRFPFVRGAIAIPIGGMLANDAITADGRQNRACGVSAVCTIERHNETSLHSMSRHSCAHRNTLFGSSMFQYVAVSHSTVLTPSAAARPFTSSIHLVFRPLVVTIWVLETTKTRRAEKNTCSVRTVCCSKALLSGCSHLVTRYSLCAEDKNE